MASPSGPPWWRATRCRRARCLRKDSDLRHQPQSAVVRWPQKLIVNHAAGYLDVYDMAEDPHERDSLTSEARALVADLCRHQQTGEESDRAPVTPNQDILERLRSLAYLGGSAATTSFLEDRRYPCYSDVGSGPGGSYPLG